MRRLTLVSSLIVLAALPTACIRDNPAFDDDCDGLDCPAESGDGDTEPTVPGDGDGEPTLPGDGDGDTTAPGDGDGEPTLPGDGDGDDGLLPTCPDTIPLSIPIFQDTFLEGTPHDGELCITEWDYQQNSPMLKPGACQNLDFGGMAMHWVCDGGNFSCDSTWLGEFAVWGLEEEDPSVMEAQVVFTAKIVNGEPNQAWLFEHDENTDPYDSCEWWAAGDGWGDPIDPFEDECVTTYKYSAYPFTWDLVAPVDLDPNEAIGSALVPPDPGGNYHQIPIYLDPEVVEGWLTGESEHTGVLLRTQAWSPTNFNLFAQGSEQEPELIVEVCSAADSP